MIDSEFTQNWWRRVISDEVKLVAWLQKLQRTEIGGYHDHMHYMKNHVVTERERMILTNIAIDEMNHSNILCDLFVSRGIIVDQTGPESTYWEQMLSDVDSTSDYCAANYFGEALAAQRFEIIAEMPETPGDIKEFIHKALPDEIFHRETLRRLAGDESLVKMAALHEVALAKLTGRK